MTKPWKPGKETVELNAPARPSRIRRNPPPRAEPADAAKKLHWSSNEREIWLAILGMLAFALAIDVIIVAIIAYY